MPHLKCVLFFFVNYGPLDCAGDDPCCAFWALLLNSLELLIGQYWYGIVRERN